MRPLRTRLLLDEPSGRSNEPREFRKIEGEDKYVLMTPSQIRVARVDAARVAVVSRENRRDRKTS